jgi:hypothetical protein
MECVIKFSIGCDGDDEEAILDQLTYLRLTATEECEQPSWCNHGDMGEGDDGNDDQKDDDKVPEGDDRTKREVEVRMEDINIPEAIGIRHI